MGRHAKSLFTQWLGGEFILGEEWSQDNESSEGRHNSAYAQQQCHTPSWSLKFTSRSFEDKVLNKPKWVISVKFCYDLWMQATRWGGQSCRNQGAFSTAAPCSISQWTPTALGHEGILLWQPISLSDNKLTMLPSSGFLFHVINENNCSQKASIPSPSLGPRMEALISLLTFSCLMVYNMLSLSKYLVWDKECWDRYMKVPLQSLFTPIPP